MSIYFGDANLSCQRYEIMQEFVEQITGFLKYLKYLKGLNTPLGWTNLKVTAVNYSCHLKIQDTIL